MPTVEQWTGAFRDVTIEELRAEIARLRNENARLRAAMWNIGGMAREALKQTQQ